MKRLRIIMSGATGCLLLCAASPGMALAAANNDPDWPCIQRKVPELSIGQVWNGPEIPETAENWNADPKIEDLVGELAARRNPLDAAQKQIVEFATGLPKNEVNDKLFHTFSGRCSKRLNREREQVISGISRYADKQREHRSGPAQGGLCSGCDARQSRCRSGRAGQSLTRD